MALVKRRIPSYLTGAFIGIVIAIVWLNLRTAFAPKFEDVEQDQAKIVLAPSAKFSVKYKQNPEKHLAWGFPSALFLAKAMPDGKFSQVLSLEYSDLVEQEVKIAPLAEIGNYEMKMSLSSCEYPGVAICLRKKITIPVEVKLGGLPEASVIVDLLSKN